MLAGQQDTTRFCGTRNIRIPSKWLVLIARLLLISATQVDQFHALGSKVILWITSMMNKDTPNWQQMDANGWFVRNGFNQSGSSCYAHLKSPPDRAVLQVWSSGGWAKAHFSTTRTQMQ